MTGDVMRTIELDAAGWKSALDFYDVILAALGAPEWRVGRFKGVYAALNH